jgi:diacylglycerol kinase family enzyme
LGLRAISGPGLEGAVRTVLDHHVAAVDVGEVNDRIFVNNSSLGIYPHVVALRQAEQHWLKRGKLLAQSQRSFMFYAAFDFSISASP